MKRSEGNWNRVRIEFLDSPSQISMGIEDSSQLLRIPSKNSDKLCNSFKLCNNFTKIPINRSVRSESIVFQ